MGRFGRQIPSFLASLAIAAKLVPASCRRNLLIKPLAMLYRAGGLMNVDKAFQLFCKPRLRMRVCSTTRRKFP